MILNHLSRWAAFVSVAIGCVTAWASPAYSQTYFELGGGWTYLTQTGPSSSGTYSHGINGRVSVGQEIAPNLRIRLDVVGIQFNRNVQYFPPCASPGCTRPYYTTQSNDVVGVVANGLVNVDPRGILYLIGGPGLYSASVPSAEWHVGVSAGAGITVPVGARLRAFTEARWHYLFGSTTGPSQLFPITVGLRY